MSGVRRESPTPRALARPVLVPGLRAIDRTEDEIQIGVAPGHRPPVARVPADAGVRRTLAAVDRGEARSTTRALRPSLIDGNLLVWPGIAAGDVAAAAAREPDRFADRLRARQAARVQIDDRLEAGSEAVRLFEAAGVGIADADASTQPPAAVLVLNPDELDRAPLDCWMARGVPLLPVRMIGTEAVIGPLVVPGRTACLRCLDLHATAADPRHPILLARHLSAVRHDGVAAPLDSALVTLAVAWAVRDLISLIEGTAPSTWSRTIRIGPDLGQVTGTTWSRHPGCGCGWSSPPARELTVTADRSH